MSMEKRPIKRVACVGEVMIELVAYADDLAKLGVAGDTFNTAVYLARMLRGQDVTVSFVTVLGQDAFSDRILRAMKTHGLDAGFVEQSADKLPGFYAIETDENGERSFSYWRSDSAARTLFSASSSLGLEVLDQNDMVVLSGITLAILPPEVQTALIQYLGQFSDQGGTVVFDSNYRPSLWTSEAVARQVCEEMWRVCDIALPSVDDEMALFGDKDESSVVQRLGCYGVNRGALKRGGRGPFDLGGTSVARTFETAPKVVDSTAAGDSFNAGFLAEIVSGGDSENAMVRGHSLASAVIGYKGAIMPEDPNTCAWNGLT